MQLNRRRLLCLGGSTAAALLLARGGLRADAGQGAVQVRFVTRSGSNTSTGSGYWYKRRDRFNNNTWFNERDDVGKPKLKQD